MTPDATTAPAALHERRRPRAVLDVSELPEVVFGHKDPNWWGTLAFIVIEGSSLAVCAASYLYLRKNFTVWPPADTPLPALLWPTVNTLLLLLVIWPMHRADQAARRLDPAGVRRWLLAATALTLLVTVLRIWEFDALQVRWDRNAYASAAWMLLGFHTALLVVDLLETGAMAVLFHVGPLETKHFSDVADAAFYQYFLSAAHVPVYVLLFLTPRWI